MSTIMCTVWYVDKYKISRPGIIDVRARYRAAARRLRNTVLPIAHGLLPGFPRHQSGHKVLKTICSYVRSSAPEDGHNDARNILS